MTESESTKELEASFLVKSIAVSSDIGRGAGSLGRLRWKDRGLVFTHDVGEWTVEVNFDPALCGGGRPKLYQVRKVVWDNPYRNELLLCAAKADIIDREFTEIVDVKVSWRVDVGAYDIERHQGELLLDCLEAGLHREGEFLRGIRGIGFDSVVHLLCDRSKAVFSVERRAWDDIRDITNVILWDIFESATSINDDTLGVGVGLLFASLGEQSREVAA